ncbi:MAG: endonuclease/exonuclease/phosphatase family protein, partial [Bacteroidetes bacterium]
DAWSLFDQILITEGLVNPENPGYHFYKAKVFNPTYLVQKTGQYKGYPFRTFDFDNYIHGYSDHFPVCIYLLKPLD